ncbi:hypothetical protein FACS189450_03360 [Spirochaetia bacterium]|nr:hypothetical protein FACS189450_03360 [Spirochaetia bacterium]
MKKNEKALQELEEIRELQREGDKAMFSIDEEDYEERLAIGEKAKRLYKHWAVKYPELAKAEAAKNTNGKKEPERTFWCALYEFEKGKRPKGHLLSAVRTRNPQDTGWCTDFHTDAYACWFTSKAKAQACLDEALRAPELYEEFLSSRKKASA